MKSLMGELRAFRCSGPGCKQAFKKPYSKPETRGGFSDEGIIPQKYQDDALHIALATYNEADAVISWNFKHMVKLKTIRGVNGINKMLGYKELEILTPQSWLLEDDNG